MRVALRVDGGPAFGIGHAMRSWTLGSELRRRGHEVTVLSAEMPDGIRQAMNHDGLVVDGSTGVSPGTDVVIYDGYHLGTELGRAPKDVSVVVIDDNRELPLGRCDVVINQNLHATAELYADARSAELLIGSQFALLRQGVLAIEPRSVPKETQVALISMGGSDPAVLTAGVLERVIAETDLIVIVAVGPAAEGSRIVRSLAERHCHRVIIDRGDLSDGLSHADVAIIGGGTTLWEVGYLGIPAVAAIVADNQLEGTRAAERYGFVRAVDVRGEHAGSKRSVDAVVRSLTELLEDTPRRRAMALAGRSLFDGGGPARVAQAIEDRWAAAM